MSDTRGSREPSEAIAAITEALSGRAASRSSVPKVKSSRIGDLDLLSNCRNRMQSWRAHSDSSRAN